MAIGIIVFFNGIFNNFVYDDIAQIVNNPATHSIKNIGIFFSGSTFFNSDVQNLVGVYFKPLLNTSFSIIYSLFGPRVVAFHLFQIALHIANACLLFLFLKHFFKPPLSLLLSVVFLIHPINSESVYFISATQEVLFFIFGITALNLLTKIHPKITIFFIGVCLLLSLFSKETGLLFVCVSVLYTIFFRKKDALMMVGFSVVTTAVYLLLRIHAIGFIVGGANAPISSLPLHERLLNLPYIIFFDLKTFIYPFNLASSYQQVIHTLTLSNFFIPLAVDSLVFCILVGLGIFIRKRFAEKYLLYYVFFFAWFVLGMAMHSQIIPLDYTIAERWFYFPIVGLLGMTGVLLDASHVNLAAPRNIIIICLIISILALRTFYRSFDWRDEKSLTFHDITVSKDDYNLESSLSRIYLLEGKYNEAKIHAERSIKLYPFFGNYNNLGVAYLAQKDYQKAKESYLQALKYGDYYLTYSNLAGLALVSGNPDENIQFLKSAIKIFPRSSQLWFTLAILEYNQKNIEDAKVAIKQAYTYDPNPQTNYLLTKIMNNQPLDLIYQLPK